MCIKDECTLVISVYGASSSSTKSLHRLLCDGCHSVTWKNGRYVPFLFITRPLETKGQQQKRLVNTHSQQRYNRLQQIKVRTSNTKMTSYKERNNRESLQYCLMASNIKRAPDAVCACCSLQLFIKSLHTAPRSRGTVG